MQKLTFRSIGKILEKPVRRKLLFLAIARITANLLDLLGLAGIAILASVFGSLASGRSGGASLQIPSLGSVEVSEVHAVLIALGVAAVFLLKSVFSVWLNLRSAILIANIEARNSLSLAEGYFSRQPNAETSVPESVSEFQNKVVLSNEAVSVYINSRITFLAESTLVLAMIGIFIAVNPIASAATLLFLGTILFFLNRFISSKIETQAKRQMDGYQGSLRITRDLFGVRREAMLSGSLGFWLQDFQDSRQTSATARGISYTLNSLPRYVIETSLILGLFAFIGGVVVFSDLPSQAVTVGVFLAGGLRLVASVLPLQSAYIQMQDGATRGTFAIEGLLQLQTVQTQNSNLEGAVGLNDAALVFDAVSYSYPGADSPVIKGVSFEISPNSKVAIVGPSGAGKSTIFDLATGFLKPSSGTIKLLGSDPMVSLGVPAGGAALVPQRPHLVTASLATNVSLLPAEKTDLLRVVSSLKRAGLGKLAVSPESLELEISPDAGQLSGGEIQRLGLARALYKNPRILFLDEATSALDAETEAEITRVLQDLKNEMTVVLIAHRLSTVIKADKIIYLDSGKVVAEGSFEDLKKKVPDFARAVALMDITK